MTVPPSACRCCPESCPCNPKKSKDAPWSSDSSLDEDDDKHAVGAAGSQPHSRLSNRGAEPLRESEVERMSGGAKRQCDRAPLGAAPEEAQGPRPRLAMPTPGSCSWGLRNIRDCKSPYMGCVSWAQITFLGARNRDHRSTPAPSGPGRCCSCASISLSYEPVKHLFQSVVDCLC
jgi:hypothetical protein